MSEQFKIHFIWLVFAHFYQPTCRENSLEGLSFEDWHEISNVNFDFYAF